MRGGSRVMAMIRSDVDQNPAMLSDEARRRFYGEKGHVRMYGRDLFSRIEASELELSMESHKSCLAALDPSYYGVNAAEDLILAVRESKKRPQPVDLGRGRRKRRECSANVGR